MKRLDIFYPMNDVMDREKVSSFVWELGAQNKECDGTCSVHGTHNYQPLLAAMWYVCHLLLPVLSSS